MHNEQHAAILTYFRFTSQTFCWKFRWLKYTYELKIFLTQSLLEKLRFQLYMYIIYYIFTKLHFERITYTHTTVKLQIEWKNKVFSWEVVKFSFPCGNTVWNESFLRYSTVECGTLFTTYRNMLQVLYCVSEYKTTTHNYLLYRVVVYIKSFKLVFSLVNRNTRSPAVNQ